MNLQDISLNGDIRCVHLSKEHLFEWEPIECFDATNFMLCEQRKYNYYNNLLLLYKPVRRRGQWAIAATSQFETRLKFLLKKEVFNCILRCKEKNFFAKRQFFCVQFFLKGARRMKVDFLKFLHSSDKMI